MTTDKIVKAALEAKTTLAMSNSTQRNLALQQLAKTLMSEKEAILAANAQDVETAQAGRHEAFLDRMTLTDTRFDAMAAGVEHVADLPDILGSIYNTDRQASGITTSKMRVPIGVLLMIYESRPNVTIDAAALALKSGNAIILKGGRETAQTNTTLVAAIQRALQAASLPAGSVQVLIDTSHDTVAELLLRDDAIDLVIPRGSRRLLEFVRGRCKIPLLLHLEGNCHTYIDSNAVTDMAIRIVLDAKTQRSGTCNATESLLIHRDKVDMVPVLVEELAARGVEIRGDEQVQKLVKLAKPAAKDDWSKEYLGPIISIKVVDSLAAAIAHINKYGSQHTDAIITEDQTAADTFLRQVDSASVLHNTSTRLADGYEYGLGAEIGISTGKLHARGPVGLEGLTTYKWIVHSNGVTKGGIVDASGEKKI